MYKYGIVILSVVFKGVKPGFSHQTKMCGWRLVCRLFEHKTEKVNGFC